MTFSCCGGQDVTCAVFFSSTVPIFARHLQTPLTSHQWSAWETPWLGKSLTSWIVAITITQVAFTSYDSWFTAFAWGSMRCGPSLFFWFLQAKPCPLFGWAVIFAVVFHLIIHNALLQSPARNATRWVPAKRYIVWLVCLLRTSNSQNVSPLWHLCSEGSLHIGFGGSFSWIYI